MIARRTLLTAAPALALSASAWATPSRDLAVRGSKSYSESSMVMSVSEDGSSAVTLRFCRFPVEGFTWLWCHVLKDGVLYAYTSHDLPCTPERLAGTPVAAYGAPPMRAALVRTGRGAQLSDVTLQAALPFHRSFSAPHGQGRVQGHLEGRFKPRRALQAQLNEGRDEVYGTFRAEVSIGGRRFVHEGPAKFHEQRQETPRFETPFCYGWLAGADAASTFVLGAKGANGGWQFGDAEDPVADMTIDAPAAERSALWQLKSGHALPGALGALVRYEIPVYGRTWRGSFACGLVGGRPVVGVINDWIVGPDIYGEANARAQPRQ
jgi:hypothetical protein